MKTAIFDIAVQCWPLIAGMTIRTHEMGLTLVQIQLSEVHASDYMHKKLKNRYQMIIICINNLLMQMSSANILSIDDYWKCLSCIPTTK